MRGGLFGGSLTGSLHFSHSFGDRFGHSLGLGNSIEKQLWLPESTNDFIFSVVCEELGFVGAVVVCLLYTSPSPRD